MRDGHSDFCVDLKKKVNPCNFSRDFKIGPHLGPGHVMNSSHVKIFRGARTYQDILGVRAITKVGNHCSKEGLVAGKAFVMSQKCRYLLW